MVNSPLRLQTVLSIALAALSADCTSWTTQGVAPRSVIEQERPAAVRALMLDGSTVKIEKPIVQTDSLVGWDHGTRVAVPLDEVTQLALPQPNYVALAIGVGFLILAGIGIVYTIMFFDGMSHSQ